MNNPAPDTAVSILRSTPTLLKAWVDEVPESLWHSRENATAWNPEEVLKHLIHGEETDWIPRLHLMISGKSRNEIPEFDPYDMDGYKTISGNYKDLWQVFQQLRMENLTELEKITTAYDLAALRARHPELGEVTGSELVHAWASHDLTHIYQISRNYAVPLLAQSGEWTRFMRIKGR